MVHIVTKILNGPSDVFLLSTDEKPLGLRNGSLCYEIDTGAISMYDAENKLWIPQ